MIMVLAISSILFFLYSFDYSYSINNENNEIQDEEFDYIFDPGEYIYSEETIEKNDNSDSEKNHNNVIKSFNKFILYTSLCKWMFRRHTYKMNIFKIMRIIWGF